MGTRILVTGSRGYPIEQIAVIRAVLLPYLAGITQQTAHEYVLMHGAGPPVRDEYGNVVSGLDYLASEFWIREGGTCLPFPAKWKVHGNSAGPIRNRQMVEHKPSAEECIGFPWFAANYRSKGTLGCMSLAHSAGIPTWRVKVDGTKERYTGAKRDPLSSVWDNKAGLHDLPAL